MYMGGAATLRLQDGSTRLVDMADPNFGPLLHGGGAVPVKPDGTPYTITQAFGGDLWDGCPIQVAIEEAGGHSANSWVVSQIEVMKAAGLVPGCLVPGSPNYSAFYVDEGSAPQSGTGIRRTSTGPTVTVDLPAILPTGVATPGIIPLPGGGVQYLPAEPEPIAPELASIGAGAGGDLLPWLLAGGLVWSLMGGRKGRRR